MPQTKTKKQEMHEALKCLYLATDASVASDVQRKVLNAFIEIESNSMPMDKVKELSKRAFMVSIKGIDTGIDSEQSFENWWNNEAFCQSN